MLFCACAASPVLIIFFGELTQHAESTYIALGIMALCLFVVTWLQYVRLSAALGRGFGFLLALMFGCFVFPPAVLIALIWGADIERQANTLLKRYGIKRSLIGLSKHDLTRLGVRVCRNCEYSMSGLDGVSVCPECGSPYAAPSGSNAMTDDIAV